MQVAEGENGDTSLILAVELHDGQSPSKRLSTKYAQVVAESLRKSNAEFDRSYATTGERMTPEIILRRFGDNMFKYTRVKADYIARDER
ncbi:MAG: hypothetical protein ACE5E0_02355 [Terriglobia bacterium]